MNCHALIPLHKNIALDETKNKNYLLYDIITVMPALTIIYKLLINLHK